MEKQRMKKLNRHLDKSCTIYFFRYMSYNTQLHEASNIKQIIVYIVYKS